MIRRTIFILEITRNQSQPKADRGNDQEEKAADGECEHGWKVKPIYVKCNKIVTNKLQNGCAHELCFGCWVFLGNFNCK